MLEPYTVPKSSTHCFPQVLSPLFRLSHQCPFAAKALKADEVERKKQNGCPRAWLCMGERTAPGPGGSESGDAAERTCVSTMAGGFPLPPRVLSKII